MNYIEQNTSQNRVWDCPAWVIVVFYTVCHYVG